ncbi:MAG TPA: glycerol-3-phosphate 1-O-acyltransferase PlsY [Acidobacteriaceae bacterium]|nr:glycerol-3-phosphate 1-O-acyltransferase PlsY [Acidobacteriaceae bacterium]
MNAWIVSIAIAYLLGSIPFGYVLVRVFRNEDIRAKGSGNIGATNVLRSGAKGLGFATLLLDMLKGLAAVLIARRIGSGNYDVEIVAAVAAVLGHVFPVWLRLRGGKGVATALGVFLALTWPSALGGLLVFIVVFAISRYVSLGSIVAALALPLLAFYFVRPWTATMTFGFLFLPALVIAKHHANIGRLLNGTENRFGRRRTEAGNARA